MKSECEKTRRRIRESIGRTLEPREGDKLEAHCAECESCRLYRARLLADDACLAEITSRHAQSISNVEQRTIEAISTLAPIRSRPARRAGMAGGLARLPRPVWIAAAAVAALAIVAALRTDTAREIKDRIVAVRFPSGYPVPAYAAVLARMEKTDNVICRERRWINGAWKTRMRACNNAGTSRIEYPDSILVSSHRQQLASLLLYPAEQRAVVSKTTLVRSPGGPPPREDPSDNENPVKRLAEWHKRHGFSFVRRKWYEGRSLAVYESASGGPRASVKFSTWVDLRTQLPMRVEITNNLPTGRSRPDLYGLSLEDFATGWPRGKPNGWVDLRADEPRIIEDDFRWNEPVDTSYFSLNPPAGYAVERRTNVFNIDFDSEEGHERVARWNAQMMADVLAEWLSCSGNAFPDDIHDIGDAEKVRPMLIAKYDKDGIPGDEFRAALSSAGRLKGGAQMIAWMKKDLDLHYLGKGCQFGDSMKVVCWLRGWGEGDFGWKPEMKTCYAIIYADLHIATSSAVPNPAKQ